MELGAEAKAQNLEKERDQRDLRGPVRPCQSADQNQACFSVPGSDLGYYGNNLQPRQLWYLTLFAYILSALGVQYVSELIHRKTALFFKYFDKNLDTVLFYFLSFQYSSASSAKKNNYVFQKFLTGGNRPGFKAQIKNPSSPVNYWIEYN